MSKNLALNVENLGKRYVIGETARYGSLRESIMGVFSRRPRTSRRDSIWALENVSFSVEQGEVVGVIGRNGAGKSTLLKVLSRITEPTNGYADIYGHIGSLIEVGTGFHQELTGRENTYLNGAILGMGRREIDRKFDEIVAFAGVEKFIDTPVKRYSSGMYLRLAFAVAAHLETDILLVDEVLAVGDIAFQRKCLGKMQDVADTGRTVLFVSHNMAAISSLCQRVIVLDYGKVVEDGKPTVAIQRYNETLASPQLVERNKNVAFTTIELGSGGNSIPGSEPLEVKTRLYLSQNVDWFALYCTIQDSSNNIVAMVRQNSPELKHDGAAGAYNVTVNFPALWLRPDVYSVHFKLMSNALELGKTRFLSDSLLFGVTGDASPELLKGALVPLVSWKID